MQYCLPSSKHLCGLVVRGLVLSPVSSSRTRNALAAEDWGQAPVEWGTHPCELTRTWRRHPRDYRVSSCSRWCPVELRPVRRARWAGSCSRQAGAVRLPCVWPREVPFGGVVSSYPFPPQQTLFMSYSTLRPQTRVTPSRRHLQIPLRKQKLRLPGSSAGKESACGAGDPGLIPGSGRCAGEGISYPLQFSSVSSEVKFGIYPIASVFPFWFTKQPLPLSPAHILFSKRQPSAMALKPSCLGALLHLVLPSDFRAKFSDFSSIGI